MKYLLTGATGYIGCNICKKFTENNDSLYCLIRESSNENLIPKAPNIHVLKFQKYEEIYKIINDSEPSTVIHLAAACISQHKKYDIDTLIDSNIKFPTILLQAMVESNVTNFINIGTSWQNNNGVYNPTCLYTATKQAFLDILQYYKNNNKINAVTLKLFDTYGPSDPRPKIMNLLKKTWQTSEKLKTSPGEQLLDFIFISDVVDAILHSAVLLESNIRLKDEYHISSKNPISLRRLVETIEEITRRKLNIEWGAIPYRQNEIMYPWEGGEWLPDWKPKITLYNGIIATFRN